MIECIWWQITEVLLFIDLAVLLLAGLIIWWKKAPLELFIIVGLIVACFNMLVATMNWSCI